MRTHQELIVLLHGFCRTRRDMAYLAGFFCNRGYGTFRPTLPTTFSSLGECVAVFAREFAGQARGYNRIHFVGHSMGGLIIRQFLAENEVAGLGRCVLIGTPNNGTEAAGMAEKYCGILLHVFKPVRSLVPGALDIAPPRNHPPPEVGVIAGNDNNILFGNLFKAEGDGRVAVASVPFAGMKELLTVPYNHLQIHHVPQVAELTLAFIRTGSFAVTEKVPDHGAEER